MSKRLTVTLRIFTVFYNSMQKNCFSHVQVSHVQVDSRIYVQTVIMTL